MGFTRFYWVLMGFNGFYLVLLVFSSLSRKLVAKKNRLVEGPMDQIEAVCVCVCVCV